MITKYEARNGVKVKLSEEAGLDGGKTGKIVCYSRAYKHLDGYDHYLVRDNGWIPIQLDDGEYTVVSQFSLTKV